MVVKKFKNKEVEKIVLKDCIIDEAKFLTSDLQEMFAGHKEANLELKINTPNGSYTFEIRSNSISIKDKSLEKILKECVYKETKKKKSYLEKIGF